MTKMKRITTAVLAGMLALTPLLWIEQEPFNAQEYPRNQLEEQEPFSAQEYPRNQLDEQEPFNAGMIKKHDDLLDEREPVTADQLYKHEPLNA
jgi:hypothetical protein